MFKKLKLFFIYKKVIRDNLSAINKKFATNTDNYSIRKIKMDWLGSIYTIINFNQDSMENRSKYGYFYNDNEIKKFINNLDNELMKLNLAELYALSNVEQIAKDKVLLVIEFKLLNMKKIYKKAIWYSILSLLVILFFSIKFLIK